MSDNDQLVFPIFERVGEMSHSVGGLTKRELFAAMAMQGLLSVHSFENVIKTKAVAAGAVALADDLITELEKKV